MTLNNQEIKMSIDTYIAEAYNHGDFNDWYNAMIYPIYNKDFKSLDIKTQIHVCDQFNNYMNRD